MTSKTLLFNNLVSSLLLITVIGAGSLCGASPAQAKSGQATSAAGATDVTGTWSGTFFPKHANVASFTMTVDINQDADGSLIGRRQPQFELPERRAT